MTHHKSKRYQVNVQPSATDSIPLEIEPNPVPVELSMVVCKCTGRAPSVAMGLQGKVVASYPLLPYG